MKGLLLAGGHGTRLRPLTFTGNKHMLPIANKPMLLYGLDHLRSAGIRDIGIILGPLKEGVVELLGDGSKHDVNITYIEQREPLGLAHAVRISEDFIAGEPFVMYLGDNLIKQGIAPLIDLFNAKKSACVIGVARVKEPDRYGIVAFDEQGQITRLVEKPKQYVGDYALVGIYLFTSVIFDAVRKLTPSWRGEFEITDAIQLLLGGGQKVHVQFVQGWWKDTGRPEDLLEANQLILHDLEPKIEGKIEEGAVTTGPLELGRGSTIRSGSTVRGPVIIGESCDIGPRAFVGPYTSIGNSVILRNSEIENSVIMDNAQIDCGKRVIDSIIGKGARIVNSHEGIPAGHKLILGDMTYISL